MIMNKTFPQFEDLCDDLTQVEKDTILKYLTDKLDYQSAINYLNYFYRLYWFASRSKAKHIVELGCTPGGSSIALLYAINRIDGRLWSCDLAQIGLNDMSIYGVDDSRRTRVSLTKAADYGRMWLGPKLDLIYLDTSHTYEDTRDEVNAWLPHLREGGLFIFHDTSACVRTVLPAIFDEISQHSFGYEYHQFPDCHGHGVLQPFSCNTINEYKERSDIVSVTYLLFEDMKRLSK